MVTLTSLIAALALAGWLLGSGLGPNGATTATPAAEPNPISESTRSSFGGPITGEAELAPATGALSMELVEDDY